MRLIEYLRLTGQTIKGFATAHQLSASTVNRIANGRTFPSLPLMRAIIAATGGRVTANDFYDAVGQRQNNGLSAGDPVDGCAA